MTFKTWLENQDFGFGGDWWKGNREDFLKPYQNPHGISPFKSQFIAFDPKFQAEYELDNTFDPWVRPINDQKIKWFWKPVDYKTNSEVPEFDSHEEAIQWALGKGWKVEVE